MLSKKPSLLISAYGNLHSFNSASKSTTSSHREGTRARQYATITGDGHDEAPAQPRRESAKPHHWPVAAKGQQHPTPYQILATKSNAAYTKHQFYALVKLYHPDLTSTSPLAHQQKLERYRLIVAAHTILSDPVKRSAYDRFGAGWNGKAEAGAPQSSSSGHPGPGPFSQSWQSGSQSNADPIWNNATWEDWEKFYAWRARKNGENTSPDPQSPLYMRNSRFILLISLLAFAGGSANYNRAQDAGAYYIEQRDLVHDRAAKDLRRVRQEVGGLTGKEERVQWFLRQREATMGGMSGDDVEAMRAEKASRVLAAPEVCRSEAVSGKGP
ncbi:J domain-containing protein 1 [Elasticomyces elasticus]|nr:J domain-containing protein 1 [Elasticomyces elasticus]KAK4969379.1 J domain-containing protein 1 [Elasticomyces elasticus]